MYQNIKFIVALKESWYTSYFKVAEHIWTSYIVILGLQNNIESICICYEWPEYQWKLVLWN